jgi:ribosome biogenesis GTPase
LEDLGWDDAREREFAPFRAEGLVPGRVALEHNHVYRVLTAAGEELAETAGRLKHRAEGRRALPVVGDWVALREEAAGARRQIRTLLARRTGFSRKAAGRQTDEQIIATNIDVVFLVFSLESAFRARRTERYLVVAERSGARSILVLNKTDCDPDLPQSLADARAAAPGIDVCAVSAASGDGFECLEGYLAPGRTLALLGPSGAGKSSIVNRLVGHAVLPTGAVRARDLRGRHTSVHRQLVVRPAGGVIIDTPGMRELQLWETDAVTDTFTDIAALAAECRFRDCQHEQEPGCAVKAAVARGALETGRYESFCRLQAEQRDIGRKRSELTFEQGRRAVKTPSQAPRRRGSQG